MITTTRSLTRFAAACALAAAVAIGGGVTAAGTPATAAPITGPLRTQALGAGELTAKLRLIMNTGASADVRANELEAGHAGLALADQVAVAANNAPPSFRYSVVGPVTVDGDLLYAQLTTAVDGYDPFYYDLSWRLIDGTWKLTRQAQCTVASVAFLPCTV